MYVNNLTYVLYHSEYIIFISLVGLFLTKLTAKYEGKTKHSKNFKHFYYRSKPKEYTKLLTDVHLRHQFNSILNENDYFTFRF